MSVFSGETMICIMSGATQQHEPNRESDWDCIVYDGASYYVSKEWRDTSYKIRGMKLTYKLILQKMLELHKGAANE